MATYYLNTRILQLPAPNSPITICSVMGYTFQDEQLYSPAFAQAVEQQIDQLRHKFATRRSLATPPEETISTAHLRLLLNEMEAGKIKQESVALTKHPTEEGVILQIHLK